MREFAVNLKHALRSHPCSDLLDILRLQGVEIDPASNAQLAMTLLGVHNRPQMVCIIDREYLLSYNCLEVRACFSLVLYAVLFMLAASRVVRATSH